MLKDRILGGCLAVLFVIYSLPALAVEAAPIVAAQDPPLTVSNIIVDKTDKNAVEARKAAIVAAKRAALLKLAERTLPADDYKAFTPPADNAISAVVQDFEITNEQLSATRYVATFTVRFRAGVQKYLGAKAVEATGAPATAAATAKPSATSSAPAVAEATPRAVLVLPYLETSQGALMLWEDANKWLKAWQAASPAIKGWTIDVPLGDIGDVAAGSSDGVWSDDFGAVEKLRGAYDADEVVIAVANASGPAMTIDLYTYKGGKMERNATLTMPPGESADFSAGVNEVVHALQFPPAAPELQDDAVIVDAAEMPDEADITAPGPETVVVTGGPVAIDAEMGFETFGQWMEVQKRLAHLSPPAAIEIQSISSTRATFRLKYENGLEALKSALAAAGVALSAPVIAVGESVPGSTAPTQTPVYELQLLN